MVRGDFKKVGWDGSCLFFCWEVVCVWWYIDSREWEIEGIYYVFCGECVCCKLYFFEIYCGCWVVDGCVYFIIKLVFDDVDIKCRVLEKDRRIGVGN